MHKLRSNGFGAIEMIMILVVLLLVAGGGFFVWNANSSEEESDAQLESSNNEQADDDAPKPESFTVKVPDEWELVVDDALDFEVKVPKEFDEATGLSGSFNGVTTDGVAVFNSQDSYSITIATVTGFEASSALEFIRDGIKEVESLGFDASDFAIRAEEINGTLWYIRDAPSSDNSKVSEYYLQLDSERIASITPNESTSELTSIVRQIAASIKN